MALSRLSLSSALCLAIALLLNPITAQQTPGGKPPVTTTPTAIGCPMPTITVSTVGPPTPCLIITSTTTSACHPHTSCPVLPCPIQLLTETQPCGCPSAVPTVYETKGCCPGCPFSSVSVVHPTGCSEPPPPPCAVVTQTWPPACPSIAGCAVPDCIYLETLTLGCDCSGVSTATVCDGKCPGCKTEYQTLHVPCPTRPPGI